MLPLLVGFVALAAEFGHGLSIQANDQRVADLAAYAGADQHDMTGNVSVAGAT